MTVETRGQLREQGCLNPGRNDALLDKGDDEFIIGLTPKGVQTLFAAARRQCLKRRCLKCQSMSMNV